MNKKLINSLIDRWLKSKDKGITLKSGDRIKIIKGKKKKRGVYIVR